MDHHYREDWFWTDEDLEKAQARLDLYRQAVESANGTDSSAAEQTLKKVREYLADDLKTSGALMALDAWAISALEQVRRW